MAAPVFISHSSRDDKVARLLCSALEGRGLKCWLAIRDVGAGDNFQESIVRAIRSSKLMVLIFTESANNSTEIRKELALASQHKLAVIPARVEDVLPSEALAYELATRQWINLVENWEHDVERLAVRIKDLLGIEQSAAISPTANLATAATATGRSEPAPQTATAIGRAPRSAKAIIAACLMIAVAVANSLLHMIGFYYYQAISIGLAVMLAISAVLLVVGERSARLIGIAATSLGIAGCIFTFVSMFEHLRTGAFSAIVGSFPLMMVAVLAAALVLLLKWRPTKP